MIKIWNVNNGSLIRTLTGHTDWINSLAVLPNGYLVSGSSDKTIKIWNTDNGILVRNITGNVVNTLTVLPNGNIISGNSIKNENILEGDS